MRRRELVIAAIAAVTGGAAVALVMGLTGGTPQPPNQAVAVAVKPKPSAPPSSPAPQTSASPAASSTTPEPRAVPAPVTHSHRAAASAADADEAPSDRVRDRVYQQPDNPRPQGQVEGPGIVPQNGTKTKDTGPSDEPITTPTPLPPSTAPSSSVPQP
ncbi:MAG TPA: hypothetical protein VG674_10725 [Amycolatopsis sp.]|nr:hypothetical protein [Amycolatopsis sp.]